MERKGWKTWNRLTLSRLREQEDGVDQEQEQEIVVINLLIDPCRRWGRTGYPIIRFPYGGQGWW